MENNIALTSDIVDLVASDLGIPKESAEYHVEFLVHWIRTLAKDPENLTIRLPHLGYMYVNVSRIENDYNYFSTLPDDQMKRGWPGILERKRRRLERFSEEFPDPGYNRHKKKSKFTSHWFNKKMTIEEMEKWQNS